MIRQPEPNDASREPLVLAEPDYPAWGFAEIFAGASLFFPAIWVGVTAVTALSKSLHLNPPIGVLTVLGEIAGYAILFAALFLIFAVNHEKPLLQSLGWVRHPLAVSSLVVTGIGLAVFILLFTALILRTPSTDTPFQKLLSDNPTRVAVLLFGITLGPVVEELLFRGFLQPVMIRIAGVLPGILITSALFGAMHLSQYGGQWQAGLGITLVGLVLGIVRHISGSTKASSTVHIAYNSVLFALMLAAGDAGKK